MDGDGFKERLMDEQNRLSNRLDKLNTFLKSESFKSIDPEQLKQHTNL